jgi:glycosyltransferase involved in cell wall biosynthesis
VHVIFTIHHDLDPNAGAAGITVALASAIERLGHSAQVLSHDDLPAGWGRRRRTLSFPKFVADAVDETDADVVDASTGDASQLVGVTPRPAVVSRSHGLEHAWDVRREDGQPRAGVAARLMRSAIHLPRVARSLRHADLTVFSNSEDRQFAVERLGVHASQARVMPNGLPTALVGQPAPEPSRVQSLRAAVVGTHIPRKGIGYGVPALAGWLREDRARRASLIGTGLAADRVITDFDTDVHEQVAVVPKYERDRLPELLRGHDILVFPSLFEGFSVGLVEAMACGLAPIAANVRGARDLLEHERTGLLVPARDSAALLEGLRRLDRERDLLLRLRLGAHRAVQELTWDRIALQTEELYLEAIERASVRS